MREKGMTMKAGSWLLGVGFVGLAMLAQEARADWVGTTSVANANAEDAKWTNMLAAADGDPTKYAIDQSNRTGDGAVLRMSFGAGVYANHVRFSADKWASTCDYVALKVNYGGATPSTQTFTFAAADYPNAAYKYVPIPAGTVTSLEFNFHYVTSGYYFWLYECQLFKATNPTTAPTGMTWRPSNVFRTSAVLHGEVASDGGEVCQVRFGYGLTPACDTWTPWQPGFGARDQAVAYVSGLVENSKYYYRIAVKNSAGEHVTGPGSFTACAEESDDGSIWESPVSSSTDSHTYNGRTYSWEGTGQAYDDWDDSAARCFHEIGDPTLWSPYIYLYPEVGLFNGVRFKAAKPDAYIDLIAVEIRKSSDWVSLYEGAFQHETWEEKPFDPYPITGVRVRFHMSAASVGAYWNLLELDVRKIGVNVVSADVPYDQEEVVGVTKLARKEASAVTFRFTPGIESLNDAEVWVALGQNTKLFTDQACTTEFTKRVYDLRSSVGKTAFIDELMNKTFYVRGERAGAGFVHCSISSSMMYSQDRVNYNFTTRVSVDVENGLRECMEGRNLTFTATAEGFEGGMSSPVKFVFHYTGPDGVTHSSTESSWDLVEDNSWGAGAVPAGDPDHFVDCNMYVEAYDDYSRVASTAIVIRVYQLWIEYFRDDASNQDWKICVGLPAEFSAIASADCKNWDWDMEDGVPDAWNPTVTNGQTGTMTIPYSDLDGKNNGYFGEEYGEVNVFCEDGEGNNHRVYSKEKMGKRAQVFFPRDLNLAGGVATAAKPPCWFIFWAANKKGPCGWCYDDKLKVLEGSVTFAYSPGLAGAQTSQKGTGKYLMELSSSANLPMHYTWVSPRYPAVGTFANSVGVATFFPVGRHTIDWHKANWEFIDDAEMCFRHERLHVVHWENWRKKGAWFGMANTDGAYEKLPDIYEDAFGTAFSANKTYPGFPVSGGYDDELDCEEAAVAANVPAARDWAFPGKQWH